MVLGHIHVNVQMKEHINLGKVSLKAVWEGMSEVHIDSRYLWSKHRILISSIFMFQFMLYSILKAGLMLKQQQPTTSTENLHFYFHLTMKNLKQWWKCVSMLYLLSKPFISKFSVLRLPLQVNHYKCNKKLSFLLKKILNFENSDSLQIDIKW